MVVPIGIPVISVYVTAANGTAAMKVRVVGGNTLSTVIDISTTNTAIVRNQWNHILIGLKQSTNNKVTLINGVNEANTGTFNTGSIFATQNGDSCVGASSTFGGADGDFFKGGMFHTWMDMGLGKYFDPVANLNKFYSGGAWVFEGANGQLPTGTSPLLFLKNPPATFGINSGTGPNHPIVGGTLGSMNPPPMA